MPFQCEEGTDVARSNDPKKAQAGGIAWQCSTTPTSRPAGGGGGGVNVIAAYLRWMEAGSVSPQTLRLRENHLGRFARSHDLLAATSDDIVGYLRRQEWKPATAASFRSSLSSFYKWALDEGLIDANPLKSVRNVRVPPAAPKIATAAALDRSACQGLTPGSPRGDAGRLCRTSPGRDRGPALPRCRRRLAQDHRQGWQD
jgi:hypothetical protein